MRISTRAHYAVRAVVDLAVHSGGSPVAIQEIARRQAISPSYLEQLFAKLRRGRVIRSVRGARGGYQLAVPADQVHLAQIMELVDEPLDPLACLDGRKSCDLAERCITQGVWRQLGEQIRVFLSSITLDQLVQELEKHKESTEGQYNSKEDDKEQGDAIQ